MRGAVARGVRTLLDSFRQSSVVNAGCRSLSSTGPGLAMSKDTATGVNIYVKGEDPKLGPDEAYPDWLWTLAEPSKTLKQLTAEVNKVGYDQMSNEDFFRYTKLMRKAKIKQNNQANAKK